MKKLSIVFAAIFLTIQAQALTQEEQAYLTIDTVTIQEIPDESPLLDKIETFDQVSPIKKLEVEVDTIINIGKKIWVIVEAGRPVVNIELNTASAMPSGISNWQQLAGWKSPRSSIFRVSYSNLYGMNVVDFTYRVIFTYGGNFNGKGHYVTGATIVPSSLDVAWGFTFKAQVEIPTVINLGQVENPIGGIQMNVNWVVGSVLKQSQTRASYFVDGLGAFKQLD